MSALVEELVVLTVSQIHLLSQAVVHLGCWLGLGEESGNRKSLQLFQNVCYLREKVAQVLESLEHVVGPL